MTQIQSNGITLEYDEFGDRSAPPMILVMGLGGQMIWWDERFCQRLADRGYRVVRFDNRDIGLSTKLDDVCPDPRRLLAQAMTGAAVAAPYTLRDMAADTAGLLDGLGIASAHVVGVSMGGMIAQRVAIHFPTRIRSLTSIMSSTGNPGLPPGEPAVLELITGPRPTDPAAALELGMKISRALAGRFPIDEERALERMVATARRSSHLLGQPRQMLAIIADGDRRAALRRLEVPALVIHGDADPLVPLAGGRDTAASIPGARMVTIEGMGHSLPEGAWPQLIDEIAAHAAAADRRSAPAPAS